MHSSWWQQRYGLLLSHAPPLPPIHRSYPFPFPISSLPVCILRNESGVILSIAELSTIHLWRLVQTASPGEASPSCPPTPTPTHPHLRCLHSPI